ncbi:MAG: hypothetical protein LBG88_01120 [Christensenellaceae bacterium]|jgi:adenosine deaminase|nr:hypothetical protein [Christensenellaceae bacterium]
MEQKKKKKFYADLHNHSFAGGTPEFLEDHGLHFPRVERVNGIEHMNEIWNEYLYKHQYDLHALSLLLKANFENCRQTGVKTVAPSITYRLVDKEKGIFPDAPEKFIEFLKSFKHDDLTINWILSINRDRYRPDQERGVVMDLIKSGFFKGIDLSSTEDPDLNKVFKDFYKQANQQGMVTQVHAGEQLGADYVMQCIKDFEPKHIQHGISIVQSPKIMKVAQKEGITFNVCPTSNVELGYAKSHGEHPIRAMYYNDLSLTINTDDMLFFNSSVPEEYKRLKQNGTLTDRQLEDIRQNSLKVADEMTRDV